MIVVQDGRGDLRLSRRSGGPRAVQLEQLPGAVQGRRRHDRRQQPGDRRRQHVARHVPRHALRLLRSRASAPAATTSPSGSSEQPHAAADRRSCSRCSCSTSGWAGSTPIIGLILLYTAFNLPYVIWMMRGYIQDIPLELEEIGAGRRLHALGRVLEGRAADGAQRASSPPPCSPSSSPGTSSCSRWS